MLFFWTAFHGFQRIVGEISRVPWLLMRGVWQDNNIHYDASLHNMRDIAQGDGSKCDWRQAVLADSFLCVCKQISGLWLPPKHRPMAVSSSHASTSLAQHPFDSLARTTLLLVHGGIQCTYTQLQGLSDSLNKFKNFPNSCSDWLLHSSRPGIPHRMPRLDGWCRVWDHTCCYITPAAVCKSLCNDLVRNGPKTNKMHAL